MKKRIHINQHKIRHNASCGEREAVISCKTYKKNHYADSLRILDDNGNVVAEVVYSPDKPLGCGAKVWIETTAKVEIVDGDQTYELEGKYA